MVALPNAPGVAKIIVKQSFAGVAVYNVLHAWHGNGDSWTQAELDTLASTTRTAWVTNVIPLQASTLTLTDVQVVDLTSDTGLGSVSTGSNAGSGSGSANPANVAICWSWKNLTRYRGGHPRTYIAAIPNTANSNANTITSAVRTAHVAAATALRTAINGVVTGGGNAHMGAVSYYKDKAVRGTPAFYEFTGVSVDDRFDSQRRRLGRDR